MADVTDIIDYYADLLIIQYNQKPKAKATIKAFVEEILSTGILFDIRDAFNLDTAIGVQLDTLGKYANIDRFYTGQTLDGYFTLIKYDEVASPPADAIGFTDYTDFETKVGDWLIYPDILSDNLSLNDDDFRFLIKLRIIQNHSDHSHKSIDDSIFAFFGNEIRADSVGNMEMFYFVPRNQAAIISVALQKKILPKPMGVDLKYAIEGDEDFFGFATYDTIPPFAIGFANYADYDTKEGDTLRYNNLIS